VKGIKYVEMFILSGETPTETGVVTSTDVHTLCSKLGYFNVI
jgi:hypothetical protein